MENYGCKDITITIPKVFDSFVEVMGLTKCLLVPHRRNGMTSSGIGGNCHYNTRKLVRVYGGMEMYGYVFYRIPNENLYWVFSHSCWITPEGKMVDITENDGVDISFYPYQLHYGSPPPKYGIYDIRTCSFLLTEDYKSSGVSVLDIDEGFIDEKKRQNIPFSSNLIKHAVDTGLAYQRAEFDFHIDKYNDFCIGSGFSKPSTATGKNFDEIWMERTGLVA